MGSPCELSFWSESRIEAATLAEVCRQEIERLEQKYSRYRDDSLASRINRSAGDQQGVEVDSETASLLDFADTAYRESSGRFDPTSGVMRRVWNFKSQQVPSEEAIAQAHALVGWAKVHWTNPRIILPLSGMELDFGGFVKEYAADRVAELCRGRGLNSGIIDLGGDLAVVGPHPNGDAWQIGIRDPRNPSQALARIAIDCGGLATSGDYERFMIVDGVRYSHLLDPRTGRCHQGGPACVSIKAPHCLVAGISSTIAMLNEESEALNFLERVKLPHLLVKQSGETCGTAIQVDPAAVKRFGSGLTRPDRQSMKESASRLRLRTAS